MSARVRKDDLVVVISGRNRGARGKVLRVFPEQDRVLVDGVNLVTKHQKPNARRPEGSREQKEAPLSLCKVMLVDPKTNEPTRVRFEEKDGKKVRVAVKSGSVIQG
jgi:large subunit ribosomal protein L24